jgi:hypothetical protein
MVPGGFAWVFGVGRLEHEDCSQEPNHHRRGQGPGLGLTSVPMWGQPSPAVRASQTRPLFACVARTLLSDAFDLYEAAPQFAPFKGWASRERHPYAIAAETHSTL